MHKYKVGQMVEIVDNGHIMQQHLKYIGLVTQIVAFTVENNAPCYVVKDLGIKEVVDESALRPINPPATGSWTEITALLGTDIRRLRETVQ